MTDELSHDGFLGGRLKLWQPRRGYRAGSDAVMLAAAVPAKTGQSVLELGCGVGAALLALGRRVPGLDLTGVEVQAPYAVLAGRNALENGIPALIVTADLAALPDDLRQRQYDHVMANPPYYLPQPHPPSPEPGRRLARGEATPLAVWIETASRRLAPGGSLHVVQKADRLPDLLAAAADLVGGVEILPLVARAGRPAGRVILRATKGSKAGFVLHSPQNMHEGRAHLNDGVSYRPEIDAILRGGSALAWPAPIGGS